MEFHYDPKSGVHMAFIKGVYVCEECGIEAPVVEVKMTPAGTEETHRCPDHPDVPLRLHHHMVPDPIALDPHKEYEWNASRQHNDGKPTVWKQNYEANRPLVTGRSVWDLPTADVVYLVGSGPSLMKNAKALAGIKTGAIVCLNDALRFMAGVRTTVARYFLAVDFIFDRLQSQHVAGWTAILPPIVAPALPKLPWADIRWIRSAVHQGVLDEISTNHVGWWRYYEGLNCAYAAVQFIVQILKPQKLVLVGVDCALTGGFRHPGEQQRWEPGIIVEHDSCGFPVMTNEMFKSQRDYLFTQLFFMQLAGIQIVNATEGGILPEAMTVRVAPRRPLAEEVKKNEERFRAHPESEKGVDVWGRSVPDEGGGKEIVPGVSGQEAQPQKAAEKEA